MKKFTLYTLVFSFAALVVAAFASCATTAQVQVKDSLSMVPSSADVNINIQANLEAELDVSDKKIVFVYSVSILELKRYTWLELKSIAVREALAANGNADVMVACQYKVEGSFDQTTTNYGSYGKSTKNHNSDVKITVTGYPAKYMGFKRAE